MFGTSGVDRSSDEMVGEWVARVALGGLLEAEICSCEEELVVPIGCCCVVVLGVLGVDTFIEDI